MVCIPQDKNGKGNESHVFDRGCLPEDKGCDWIFRCAGYCSEIPDPRVDVLAASDSSFGERGEDRQTEARERAVHSKVARTFDPEQQPGKH